jgi:beta-phosphoglucomutase-like phosphatase (HAD superfamily)
MDRERAIEAVKEMFRAFNLQPPDEAIVDMFNSMSDEKYRDAMEECREHMRQQYIEVARQMQEATHKYQEVKDGHDNI